MKVTGKIKEILELQQGESKAGKSWQKKQFVLTVQDGEYSNDIPFTVFGEENVDKFDKNHKVGDKVDVNFNLRGNEWKGKWFLDATAWGVFKPKSKKANAPQVEDEDDDLPF